MQHSDCVAGYMQLGEVLKMLTIHHGSFSISKQQFTDQPVNELTSSGVKYTRAPLGARRLATCSMVQTYQVNWTITISADTLAIQLNETNEEEDDINKRINFNGKINHVDPVAKRTSIYAREQAVISSNSLSDLRTSNSVSVSPLESIINDKRHCRIFIDIPLSDIDEQSATTPQYFKISFDIIFSGFEGSLVNKQDTVQNLHLAYHMIPPEKQDIVNLLAEPTEAEVFNQKKFNVRIFNMQNASAADRGPQN
ncbi:MAG: hypothetical protein EZS28_041134, partial [Streblomastix strix]